MGTETEGPSSHLSWLELACHNGTIYPLNWRMTRAMELAWEFEAIRTLCGDRPIRVLSGYRTKDYNTKIGGAQFSQHVQGRALDLKPPAKMTLANFESVIRSQAQRPESKLKGLGIYPTFLHIDVRPSTKLVVWYGSRKAAEVQKPRR